MDTGSIIGVAAAVAGVAAAVRKKKERRRGGSSPGPAARWKALLGTSGLGVSLDDLLSGRSLLAAPGSASGKGGGTGSPGRGPSRGPGSGAGSRSPGPFRATRRPGAREMEREGVPHPLLVRRRRARRKELLREMANVGMGSAAIGVSSAGLLFDGGITPEWSLIVGGLAAVVFGWVFGREVASDLLHLGP